jgi:hypothetical protein
MLTRLLLVVSGGDDQVQRPLLDCGVLERALHLVRARRVAPPVVQVLRDRIERRPLGAGALLPLEGPEVRPASAAWDYARSAGSH